jgi:hypothetical protein
MPERIQRSRQRGWRMPDNTVYVGRPTRWGNPFKGEQGADTGTRQMLADEFRAWLTMPTRRDPRNGVAHSYNGSTGYLGAKYDDRPAIEDIRRVLVGKNLACWCHVDQPCHADVLLEIANTPAVVTVELAGVSR